MCVNFVEEGDLREETMMGRREQEERRWLSWGMEEWMSALERTLKAFLHQSLLQTLNNSVLKFTSHLGYTSSTFFTTPSSTPDPNT